jgi:hypothetical protein
MKFIPVILLFLAFATSSLQRASDSNKDILGTWVFDKIEFVYDDALDPEEKDFIEALLIPMLEEGLSFIQLSFYADGTMRTLVDAPDESADDLGYWNLSADGKVLTLHSEEGSDAHDVHLLNDTEMILAMEDDGMTMIMHLKKK